MMLVSTLRYAPSHDVRPGVRHRVPGRDIVELRKCFLEKRMTCEPPYIAIDLKTVNNRRVLELVPILHRTPVAGFWRSG
jgi:hypothetical protein